MIALRGPWKGGSILPPVLGVDMRLPQGPDVPMPSRYLRDQTVIYRELQAAVAHSAAPAGTVEFVEWAYQRTREVHLTHKPRKSGEPYMWHPLRMLYTQVVELGICHPITNAVTLLHDTVEDQLKRTIRFYGVNRRAAIWLAFERGNGDFGPELVRSLRIITHNRKLHPLKVDYLRDIEERGEWPELQAKLDDRDDNVATFGSMSIAKQLREARETLQCFDGILEAYKDRCPPEHYYDGTVERTEAMWRYRMKPTCEAVLLRHGEHERGDA